MKNNFKFNKVKTIKAKFVDNSQTNFAQQMMQKYDTISEADKQILDLIDKNCETEADKKALVKGLNALKKDDISADKKEKAKSRWSLFWDEAVKKTAGKVVEELPELSTLPESIQEVLQNVPS